jgi:flavin-dependent dehydrogenase
VRVSAEIPELYFCNDLSGYGWCFRKGEYLNIGLGRLDKNELSTHVRNFCNFLRASEKLSGEMPPHFLGHAYQLYAERMPNLSDDGVLLVGDAAGLAYPNSGEGIRPAIESAIIAADVIATCQGTGDFGPRLEYRQRLEQRFGTPRPLGSASWLPAAWLHGIAARLMATRWFAKNIVVENWFLHRRQDTLSV